MSRCNHKVWRGRSNKPGVLLRLAQPAEYSDAELLKKFWSDFHGAHDYLSSGYNDSYAQTLHQLAVVHDALEEAEKSGSSTSYLNEAQVIACKGIYQLKQYLIDASTDARTANLIRNEPPPAWRATIITTQKTSIMESIVEFMSGTRKPVAYYVRTNNAIEFKEALEYLKFFVH